jgi:hypothetical protein
MTKNSEVAVTKANELTTNASEQPKKPDVAKKSVKSISDWRGIAIAGYAVIIMTFGVAGVWAAVAKLDKAVVAQGFVAVETNRKSVQHFEGGIVREIFVREAITSRRAKSFSACVRCRPKPIMIW